MTAGKIRRARGIGEELIRFTVGVTFVSLLLALGLFAYIDRATHTEARRGASSALVEALAASAHGPTAFEDRESARRLLQALAREPSALAAGIYTLDGTQLADWTRAPSAALPALQGERERASGLSGDELWLTAPILGPDDRVGTLHVVFSTADVRARTERNVLVAGVLLALGAWLALALARRRARAGTQQLERLVDAAERVRTERDLSVRAAPSDDEALGPLTDAFNAALEALEAREVAGEACRSALALQLEERTRELAQKGRDLRALLDRVDLGLVMVDRAGMPSARSATFDRWFGAPEPGQTFAQVLARGATGFDARFALQWEQLMDGCLPLALNIAQLPSSLATSDGNHYRLAYHAVQGADERFERLLVIVTDVTEQVEQARLEELRLRSSALLEDAGAVRVDRDALTQLCDAVRAARPHDELERLAVRLRDEPVQPKLARIGERARLLAEHLGKGPMDVDVQAEGVLAPSELNWLFHVLPHVVANSVDHGLDREEERREGGKASPPKLRIAALESPSGLVIEIEDDGRGIDWQKVKSQAERLGLPTATSEELVHALFAVGVSAREQTSELPGRGVGLAAVQAACAEHGARIGVVSEPGKGTLFRFNVDNHNDAAARRGVA